MRAVSDDYYPPASRRLGEEGRVLVEFHLDEQRKPRDVTILPAPWTDEYNGGVRLAEGAARAIKDLQFVQSDRTKPNLKRPYRVTVIFCLDPGGHCGDIVPFPRTTLIMVKGKPHPRLDFPIS
jgi:TonB family protein